MILFKWWKVFTCTHPTLRPVYGEEILLSRWRRFACTECGAYVEGHRPHRRNGPYKKS